jgi:hypothetical protein
LERRARSTASRKSRHCMKHGKPTHMTACRERPSRAAPVQTCVCLVTGRTIPYAFCPETRRERWRRALTIRESHIQLYMYAKLTQSACGVTRYTPYTAIKPRRCGIRGGVICSLQPGATRPYAGLYDAKRRGSEAPHTQYAVAIGAHRHEVPPCMCDSPPGDNSWLHLSTTAAKVQQPRLRLPVGALPTSLLCSRALR